MVSSGEAGVTIAKPIINAVNDSIATVNADISGRNNQYNSVYASFATTAYSMQMNSVMNFAGLNNYQKDAFKDDIKIRYTFIESKTPTYVDMAKKYQE